MLQQLLYSTIYTYLHGGEKTVKHTYHNKHKMGRQGII